MADTVVSPSSMGSWQLFTTDNASNTPGSGSGTGTAAFVTGPGGVGSLGTGSVELATGAGHGDESSQLRNSDWAGTALANITTLSFSTYATASNGGNPVGSTVSQDSYLTLYLSNGDRAYFEPVYSAATLGTPTFDTWQNWNAISGMWYSDHYGGPGANTITFSQLVADEGSGVTIVNTTDGSGTNLGGIRFAAGFASASNNLDVNIDDFSFGTAAGVTTYDFEPNGSVATPLPSAASMGVGLICVLGVAGLLRKKLRVA